jgi:hypothetical protein
MKNLAALATGPVLNAVVDLLSAAREIAKVKRDTNALAPADRRDNFSPIANAIERSAHRPRCGAVLRRALPWIRERDIARRVSARVKEARR